ncbi:MAG: MBL fold metallo-hydrolase [Planctomycetota bacterium]|nr:MBL fold metallo-hydrolase [Planctomycetota bacterium]
MKRLEVLRVTKSVYCVQRVEFLSCAYFVVTDGGVVLIDSGMDIDGEDMRLGLAEAGFDFPDVTSILITHWHNDHSTGAAAIVDASGAEVVCHAGSADRLARRETASGLRRAIARLLPMRGFLSPMRGLLELAPPRAVESTRHVKEGERVHNDFLVMETPGHIASHLSYFYEPEGVLFTGDAIAVARERVSFMSRFLTEDKTAARESMLRCIDLEADAYCPGHRAPLVNPSKEHLQRTRERVETMRWWPIIGCGES